METKIRKIVGLSLVLLAVMALLTQTPALAQPLPPPGDQPIAAARPAADHQTGHFELCAGVSAVTMPDGEEITIWGFGEDSGLGCLVQLPGPELRVPAGTAVTVELVNYLPVATSIIFPGQSGVTTSGGSSGAFTAEAPACPDPCLSPTGPVSYSFSAGAPGTYLYESGTADQPQTAMGLYGALIVDSNTAGQAYSSAATAYHVEEVLVLSEIDPDLNANPSGFNLLDYNPTYWLLNGRAYGGPAGANTNPDVLDPDDASAQPYSAAISAAAGQRVLVRYINAGGTHDTMALLGQYQRIIARNADELTGGQAYDATAETVPSGQTADAIMVFNTAGSYPLYNRQLHLTNGDFGPDHLASDGGGGMMTFVTVTGVAPGNTAPSVSASADQTTIALPANVVNLDGTVTDDGLLVPFTTTWSQVSGPGSPTGVTFGNASLEDTTATFTAGPGVYVLRLTADDGEFQPFAEVTVTVNPPPVILYLSLSANVSLNGGTLPTQANDILSFDGTNFAVFFDGGDVGLGTFNVDAFDRLDADTILLSVDNGGNVPGFGPIDDEDILRFDATSLGSTTVGAFSMYFDGSDVGLGGSNDDDVDAIELLPDNSLVISTVGPPTPFASISPTPQDEDLLRCAGTFGSVTSCAWSMYFDGSDVSLGSDAGEDVDAVGFAANGIYLSTLGGFFTFDPSPPGTGFLSGAGEDVFLCGSPVTGASTSCTIPGTVFFDGTTFGIPNNVLDGIDMP
ncbi:MAG: multicopper oxidase domain-containing protein [Anaerolineae bacterium]|nr:multicopper oxidase domain-containing protein [Anaerolineae bacterium]